MPLAIIYTRATLGVQAPAVCIEAHISNGLPGLTLVGLPETSVKEARDRVRSALLNSGYTFPAKRITINLAPADLPKGGARFDLPIALAILAASEQLPVLQLEQFEFLGELALSGEVRAVNGAIPAALAAMQAGRRLILPAENSQEVGLIPEGNALVAESLLQVCGFLHEQQPLSPGEAPPELPAMPGPDLQDVIGQEQAKRALTVAAAGGHNLLLIGPPGTGKTMLANRLNSLLPPLTNKEALATAAIASLIHTGGAKAAWRTRPFRQPHHSASMAALVGGGSLPRPGEISLAHHGVLFLDELPEFERRALDALREPLESGEISIARANGKLCFPARVQLIAAMNPSPSGYYQGPHTRATPQQILRYLARLSGPFLDRFDLSIEVPLLPAGVLSRQQFSGESSEKVRERVITARETQLSRAGKINALLDSREVERYCHLQANDAQFLETTLMKLGLSARAWQRILKVARTLADLDGKAEIQQAHLAEALSYRCMDRLLLQLQRSLG